MGNIKTWTKQKIKDMLSNSPKAKAIIKKLNKAVSEGHGEVKTSDVIWPRTREYLYNKRINNYLWKKVWDIKQEDG